MRKVSTLVFILTLLHSYSLSQDTTNTGKEFWVGYGHTQFMEDGSNSQNMIIYLATGSQPATVTVTLDSSGASPALWWKRTYNIPANTVISTEAIPKGGSGYDARLYSPLSASTGIFRKAGIHIESTEPVTAYAHIYVSVSSGATMLLPVQAWGHTYTSLNSKQYYLANSFSWAYIIAKEDSTVVQITPSVITRAQNLTGLQPGVAKTVVLNKGWIYQLMGANDGADANGNGGTSPSAKELTGTLIKSMSQGKPIAVFSGSSRTQNPASCGSSSGDNDIGQLFPLHTWGTRYLTAPTSASSNPSVFTTNIFKIIVNDPSTIVKRNGAVLTGLINNAYYTLESNTASYIEADKPIMVGQFLLGGPCIGPGNSGDPDMVYLTPIDAGLKNVKSLRITKENITTNYLTLIIPTAGVTSLQIDGGSVFTHTYPHPQLPGYTVVIKQWAAAQSGINISSDSAFTGITYGYGNVESYAMNIGAKFNASNGADPMYPARWLGTTSGDWNTGSNWSTGVVPNGGDHVLIPPATPFPPVISTGIISVKSLTVPAGASVTVASGAKLIVLN